MPSRDWHYCPMDPVSYSHYTWNCWYWTSIAPPAPSPPPFNFEIPDHSGRRPYHHRGQRAPISPAGLAGLVAGSALGVCALVVLTLRKRRSRLALAHPRPV